MSNKRPPKEAETRDFSRILLDVKKSEHKKQKVNHNTSTSEIDALENVISTSNSIIESDGNKWYEQEPTIHVDRVQEFDPSDLARCPLFLVFGARRVGKTHLMTWLLSHMKKDVDHAYLFSNTASVQIAAWDMIVSENKFNGYQESVLENIWQKQISKFQELDDLLIDTVPDKDVRQKQIKDKAPRYFFVFDDIISDERIRKSKYINDIFVMGRHYNFGACFLSQAVSASASFNNMCRPNVDYVISSHMNSMNDWENLARSYLSFGHWHQAYHIAKAITSEKYRFVVATHCIRDDEDVGERCFETCLSKVKAPAKLKRFELGDKEAWLNQKFLDRRRSRERLAPKVKNKMEMEKIRLPKGGFIMGITQPVTELDRPNLGVIQSLRSAVRVLGARKGQ